MGFPGTNPDESTFQTLFPREQREAPRSISTRPQSSPNYSLTSASKVFLNIIYRLFQILRKYFRSIFPLQGSLLSALQIILRFLFMDCNKENTFYHEERKVNMELRGKTHSILVVRNLRGIIPTRPWTGPQQARSCMLHQRTGFLLLRHSHFFVVGRSSEGFRAPQRASSATQADLFMISDTVSGVIPVMHRQSGQGFLL